MIRGFKTSEFFVILAAGLGQLAAALSHAESPGSTARNVTWLGIAYAIGRSLTKINWSWFRWNKRETTPPVQPPAAPPPPVK